MAVLTALLATALLTALGLSIALLGAGEGLLASHDRTARSLRHASHAAVHLAVADLRAAPSWADVLVQGAARFTDGGLRPAAPWGGSAIDLAALTARVQAASDAAIGSGDPPVWRLFDYGPLDRAIPGGAAGPWYLVVWIADDRADSDGDPSRDSNGMLTLRAAALGPGEAVATTEVALMRTAVAAGPDRVRILTIRSRP